MIAGYCVAVGLAVYEYLTGEFEVVDVVERTDTHFVFIEFKQVIEKACSTNFAKTSLRPFRCFVALEVFLTRKPYATY